MKKILISGKPDDTLTELEKRLSEHYTVRHVSAVPIAVSGILGSFRPDAVVIKTADADDSVFAHIAGNFPELKVIAAGNADARGDLPHFRSDAVCAFDAGEISDAVFRIMPFSPDDKAEENAIVMVIDDDIAILSMMKTMLDKDYKVMPAPSGDKALRLIGKKKPDVILLDYEMPEMNGVQTLGKLREDSGYADIPVIFMTGAKDPAVIESIVSLGVSGYLIKPAKAEEIKKAVSDALKR